MQDKEPDSIQAIANCLRDVRHARHLLKVGLHKQALVKLSALESSLHTVLAVNEIQPLITSIKSRQPEDVTPN